MGTDRDTRTSTGWCGCVVPSDAAFLGTYISVSAIGCAAEISKKVRNALVAPHQCHSHRNRPDRNKISRPPTPVGPWLPLPLTAATESRRSSRSAARKNGLDAEARISHADRSPANRLRLRAPGEAHRAACHRASWDRSPISCSRGDRQMQGATSERQFCSEGHGVRASARAASPGYAESLE